MDDRYFTIVNPSITETKVRGSRFIGQTELADSVVEAASKLNVIRKREHAATHNCYAYRVGLGEGVIFKYSDDGEPSGTAGRPIYDVICGNGLTNILLVVTRYFGGTKLGTGGLVRAYSEAAKRALGKSGRKENFITDIVRVNIDSSLYDRLARAVHGIGARQTDADFSDRVTVYLQVRRSLTDRLISKIAELSGGRAEIERQ